MMKMREMIRLERLCLVRMRLARRCLPLIAALLAAVVGLSARGTLIVSIPTAEGMYVVSDRLGHNKLTGFSDTFDKVIRVNPSVAVAATGTAIFGTGTRSGTNVVFTAQLSIWKLAQAYLVTNPIGQFDGKMFADCMTEQLSNYLAGANFKLTAMENPGCQIIVFQATPDKECRTFVVRMQFSQGDSGLAITTTCRQQVLRANDLAQVTVFGATDLAAELMQGHDPQYDALRNDPAIAKFLPNPPRIYTVDVSDAQAFARRLMMESSARTDVIGTNWDGTFLWFQ